MFPFDKPIVLRESDHPVAWSAPMSWRWRCGGRPRPAPPRSRRWPLPSPWRSSPPPPPSRAPPDRSGSAAPLAYPPGSDGRGGSWDRRRSRRHLLLAGRPRGIAGGLDVADQVRLGHRLHPDLGHVGQTTDLVQRRPLHPVRDLERDPPHAAPPVRSPPSRASSSVAPSVSVAIGSMPARRNARAWSGTRIVASARATTAPCSLAGQTTASGTRRPSPVSSSPATTST